MKNRTMLSGMLIGNVITALMLIALVIAPMRMAQADSGPGVPGAGTMASGPATYTWFTTKVLTSSTTTTYTLQPSRVIPYYSADVFVTGVVSGTDPFTVTAQYSNDNTNWVDATYTYLVNSTTSATTITSTADITDTNVATATMTTTASDAINTANYQVMLNSSTTKYFQLPIVGEYLRFRIDNGGTVTPTIKVTLKNTAGR